MALSPGVREWLLLRDGNRIQKFLSNAGFYPTSRNPPIVQVKLLCGYLNCLLESGEVEFPVNLTFSHLPPPFPRSHSASTNRSPSPLVSKTAVITNSEEREGSVEYGGALCRTLEAPWVLPLTLAPFSQKQVMFSSANQAHSLSHSHLDNPMKWKANDLPASLISISPPVLHFFPSFPLSRLYLLKLLNLLDANLTDAVPPNRSSRADLVLSYFSKLSRAV